MKKFIIHYIFTAQLVPVLLMKQQLFLWRKTAVLRENLNIISTIELSWSNILKEYLSYSQKKPLQNAENSSSGLTVKLCLRLNSKGNLQGLWHFAHLLVKTRECIIQSPLLKTALGASEWGSLRGSYSIEEAESLFLLHQNQEKCC